MNLALSALLILLLLLPAFSFRLGIAVYSAIRDSDKLNKNNLRHHLISRNVSKALAKLSFTETIFLFSLVPVILHLLSLLIIGFSHTIPFDLLLNIFSGKDDVITSASDSRFHYHLNWFLVYTLIEVIAGCILGCLLAWAFMSHEWMIKALMGNNIWYRLFAGLPLAEKDRKRIHSILVEVLVFTKETTVIYSGLLKNYEVVSDSDQLSYLTLQSASRRDLRASEIINKNPATATESIKVYDKDYGPMINIPGHNFTLQGKDIINVNVTYMELVPAPTPSHPDAVQLKAIET